jgi:NADPH:quinone reductase-like Zn-dependent oxidoreductase
MAAAVGQVEGLQLERQVTDLGVPQLPRTEGVARHPVLHPQRRVSVVDAEYALEDLPAALAHLDRGAFGKVVVRVGQLARTS